MTTDLDDIADELAPSLCGKTLAELQHEFKESPARDLKPKAKALHDLYAAAATERYKRMGLKVIRGNAQVKPIREPGEEG